MFTNAVINSKSIEKRRLKLVFLLALAVTGCPLAVHVGSATQSPHRVEQCVCHGFTCWEENTETGDNDVDHHHSSAFIQKAHLGIIVHYTNHLAYPVNPIHCFFVIYPPRKGWSRTYLRLWKQSRGFSWGRSRCCGGTSGTWNHSGTCWSRRCRSTCPAGCSILSWQGFPCPSGR